MAATAKKQVGLSSDLILKLHQVNFFRHLARFTAFAVVYFGSASTTVRISESVTQTWQWLSLIPLYLLSAASLHGISLFTHEAVHGTLCRQRLLNDVLGALCAFPVLQTCRAYRVLHLQHHAHLGDAGDPDHYENYTQWTWMVFTMNWLRLLIGYPVYLAAIPILGFRQGTRSDRVWIVAEVVSLAGIISLIIIFGISAAWLVHGWLIPMLIINAMVNIRGMSQHTLLEHASDPIQGTRTILTTPVVRFFMCNENYHLEHHLYPGIPWHSLPKVHTALRDSLSAAGAPYIRSYTAFVFEFLRHSLKRSPLGRKGNVETR